MVKLSIYKSDVRNLLRMKLFFICQIIPCPKTPVLGIFTFACPCSSALFCYRNWSFNPDFQIIVMRYVRVVRRNTFHDNDIRFRQLHEVA